MICAKGSTAKCATARKASHKLRERDCELVAREATKHVREH